MTHSLSFSQVMETALLRGVDTSLISDLFMRKGPKTPVLLLSRSEVRRNYQALKQALPRAEVHYAVKSNNHDAILREVFDCGGNFDVCSAAEIDLVTAAGAKPSALMHTHPIKSTYEFDYAISKGVETFVVDNIEEVRKLRRYTDRKLKVLIRYRINTNTTAVVDLQYKFGCTPDEVPMLAREIQDAGHTYHGLCFHIGSQCVFSENYVQAIHAASELIQSLSIAGFTTRLLDIGGGFPIQYVELIPSIESLCKPISAALAERISPEIRIICEPGRFISGSPVTLVCSVVGKALRDGKIWYYLDDGLYSTFSGIVFDHCQYPVITNKPGEGKLSVLAGPTCDSFDVMYDGLVIPEHEIGDMFVFPLTGAYCAVSGSDFNSLKRPEYIVID